MYQTPHFCSQSYLNKLRVAIFASIMWQCCDLHEIHLTKRGFVGVKVAYREHALLYPTDSFESWGGTEEEALDLTTMLTECCIETKKADVEHYILKTNLGLPDPNNQLIKLFLFCSAIFLLPEGVRI